MLRHGTLFEFPAKPPTPSTVVLAALRNPKRDPSTKHFACLLVQSPGEAVQIDGAHSCADSVYRLRHFTKVPIPDLPLPMIRVPSQWSATDLSAASPGAETTLRVT